MMMAVAALLALISGLLAVCLGDLVYSSLSLALLGIATAAVLALLGYKLPAILMILIYVAPAVMLLIVSISMIGGVERDARNLRLGAATGLATFALSFTIYLKSHEVLSKGLLKVQDFDERIVAELLLSEHLYTVAFIALFLLTTALGGLLLLRFTMVSR